MNERHLFFNKETNNLVIEFERFRDNLYIFWTYDEIAWDSLDYYGNQDEVNKHTALEMMEDLRNSNILNENKNF